MNNTHIDYQPIFIQLYTVIAFLALAFVPLIFSFKYEQFFGWWLTTLIVFFPLALKLAAPRIPFRQAMACSFIVIAINYLSGLMFSEGELTLWWLLGKLIPVICVLGFGAYWSRCNFIPAWANKW